jgi:glycosyltransferase involved in cell wall biosynthesis
MIKKLFLVIEEFNASGGLRVLSAICDVAVAAGIEVTIVCPDYASVPFFPLNKKVKILAVSTHRSFRRIYYLLAVFRLRWVSNGLFITGNYRLISLIVASGYLARREKSLFVVQGLDRLSLIELTITPQIVKLINQLLLGLAQRVPCHRVYVSNFLKNAYGNSGTLIPNFVAPQFLDDQLSESINTSKTIRIGCVCTSAPNKGFRLFLDALILMQSDLDLANLNIEFACATQDRILALEYENSGISFFLPTSDEGMHEFYRGCEIFTSLSISEGFGLPVLEAMASGCAVVCTNSGGVTDFVLDGQTGLVLSERSAVDVAKAWKLLVLNTPMREALAITGKAYAKNYTYDRFANNYLDLFRELSVST